MAEGGEGISTAPTAEAPASSSPAAHEGSIDCHVFQPDWSKLSRDVLVDRIKGAIYGQAIGDALGLATEFMTKEQAQKTYGKHGPASYSVIVPDFHRMRWDQGDWTDDTDQMLLILLSIVENNGRVDKADFAKRMLNWKNSGFAELGDVGGMGIGKTTSHVLTNPRFLEDPHTAAAEVWESSGRYLAANGAIMRTSVLGILNFNNLDKVVENTTAICKVTHADPRCIASCIAVTTAIAMMLQGNHDLSNKKQLGALVETALSHAEKAIILKDQIPEMRQYAMKKLTKLELDSPNTIGYTFKALGAGFYGLRKGKDFKKTITELIMEAGDADSNGSVCGALMGCKLGYHSLPPDLLQFHHRQWLDDKVDAFLKTIGLQE